MKSRGGRIWAGTGFVIVFVAIVTLVAYSPWLIAADDARRPPQDPHPTSLQLPNGLEIQSLERAKVEQILDGDTLDVRMETENRVYTVRYYGVDTPEAGDHCYREATDRNTTLVEGKTLYLLEGDREEDDFARLLRYVFLEDGTSVDATLVAEGFGEAWRRDGEYREAIIGLEDQAKAEQRGCLWKAAGS
jgi:micrococcal nuclease